MGFPGVEVEELSESLPGEHRGRTGVFVPVLIAVGMVLLVGVSIIEGGSAPASALPAPQQYTSPTTNSTTNFWSSPLGLATIGGVVAVVLIALVLLLLMRRRKASSVPAEGNAGEDGDEDAEGGDEANNEGSEDEEPPVAPDS